MNTSTRRPFMWSRLAAAFTLLIAAAALSAPSLAQNEPSFAQRLAAAALARTEHAVRYEPAYVSIAYPGGDVPADTGVCTDVVIRSYRALGVDLQVLVHEDMSAAFDAYPTHWGLRAPDTNIDHRRVPNLRVFFKRHGQSLAVSQNPAAYQPGDLVTWTLRPRGFLPHIGVVSDQTAADGTPLIVHNIGAGPQLENILFAYHITGHYRFEG